MKLIKTIAVIVILAIAVLFFAVVGYAASLKECSSIRFDHKDNEIILPHKNEVLKACGDPKLELKYTNGNTIIFFVFDDFLIKAYINADNKLTGTVKTPLYSLTSNGHCNNVINMKVTVDEYSLVYGKPIRVGKNQVRFEGLPLIFSIDENNGITKCEKTSFAPHYDYYRESTPEACGSYSYRYRINNNVTTLEIAPNVYYSHIKNKIVDVKLPSTFSQQLRYAASKKKLGADLDLPFYIWFTKNVTGPYENNALDGLCYLFEHSRNSDFKPLLYYIDLYMNAIKK